MDTNLHHVSSSEELTPEQKLILSSTTRQEPQGEEHSVEEKKREENFIASKIAAELKHGMQNSCDKARQKTMSRCSSASSLSDDDDSSNSSHESSNITEAKVEKPGRTRTAGKAKGSSNRNSGGTNYCNLSSDSNSQSAYNTLIIHRNNSSLLADTWIPASHEFTSVGLGHNRNKSMQSNPGECKEEDSEITSTEISGIPRDYLAQFSVLKHLAKEVKDPVTNTMAGNLLRSASFSRSQPDLSQNALLQQIMKPTVAELQQPNQNQSTKIKLSDLFGQMESGREKSNAEDVMPSVQMLEILMRENSNLKAELANARRKINTIHKMEAELARLQAQHAALFEATERRESLERTAREKLSSEVKRLYAVNRDLMSTSNSLQNLNSSASSTTNLHGSLGGSLDGNSVDSLKKELAKKDAIISHLFSQNKELTAAKERQEIELAAQAASLNEMRSHIDILDNALTNSQSKVLRLQEENHKKHEYVEKVGQLQQALSSLQLQNEKREQSEKKLRAQLELEVVELKRHIAASVNSEVGSRRPSGEPSGCPTYGSPPPYPGGNNSTQQQNVMQKAEYQSELQQLQENLRLSEEKIKSLTAVVCRWEKFFGSDDQDNKCGHTGHLPSVSTPQTPSSWTSSRGGTPQFFPSGSSSGVTTPGNPLDDFSSAQSRASDLVLKIKDLESRLVERDAVIRALHMQSVTPPPGSSAQHFSNSTGNIITVPSSQPAPAYRESPNYSSALGNATSLSPGGFSSKSSNPLFYTNNGSQMDPALFYSRVTKCESEPPPSYANVPMKTRLGGSGSSLAKNSNESLATAGGLQSSMGNNSGNFASTYGNRNSHERNIDEQLKELDQQILTKDVPSLKMHSGLCCIPGFSHSSTTARKGKISQSFLESITQPTSNASVSKCGGNLLTSSSSPLKRGQGVSVLPPLPKPSLYYGESSSRTSSGPPFLSPATIVASNRSDTISSPFSTSVDSMLAEKNKPISSSGLKKKQDANNKSRDGSSSCESSNSSNVFTPATVSSALPKGLPPRGPAGYPDSSKCRSLERDQRPKASHEPGFGKYTMLTDDSSNAARCRSLDRKELKAHSKVEEKSGKEEKKSQKSSVGAKAAFFGGLLSRRSPSPSRNKDKDDKVLGNNNNTTTSANNNGQIKMTGRFPFARNGPVVSQSVGISPSASTYSSSSSNSSSSNTVSENDIDTEFLDKQGRSSQRNRISKWTKTSLEAVQEHSGRSGSESPAVGRRASAETAKSETSENDGSKRAGCRSTGDESEDWANEKKWGRIVKTPFGLRYTFGSPRIANNVPLNGSCNQNGSKDGKGKVGGGNLGLQGKF